jgi:hypothetical protein
LQQASGLFTPPHALLFVAIHPKLLRLSICSGHSRRVLLALGLSGAEAVSQVHRPEVLDLGLFGAAAAPPTTTTTCPPW